MGFSRCGCFVCARTYRFPTRVLLYIMHRGLFLFPRRYTIFRYCNNIILLYYAAVYPRTLSNGRVVKNPRVKSAYRYAVYPSLSQRPGIEISNRHRPEVPLKIVKFRRHKYHSPHTLVRLLVVTNNNLHDPRL